MITREVPRSIGKVVGPFFVIAVRTRLFYRTSVVHTVSVNHLLGQTHAIVTAHKFGERLLCIGRNLT